MLAKSHTSKRCGNHRKRWYLLAGNSYVLNYHWFSWSKLQTNKKIMASQCWADFSSRVIDSHDWQINVLLKHDWKTDKLQMNEHRNTVNNNHNKQGKLHSLKDCSLRNVCTVENREWTWVNVTFWNRVSKKLNWHCKTKEKNNVSPKD